MKIFKNIISFFKKIFSKTEEMKMLEEPKVNLTNKDRKNFINSLKIEILQNKKKKVETMTCFGDGLGIQTKINY